VTVCHLDRTTGGGERQGIAFGEPAVDEVVVGPAVHEEDGWVAGERSRDLQQGKGIVDEGIRFERGAGPIPPTMAARPGDGGGGLLGRGWFWGRVGGFRRLPVC
jgi:hypothetical protein